MKKYPNALLAIIVLSLITTATLFILDLHAGKSGLHANTKSFQEAKSLKEIYELAQRIHIGSENDQKALAFAVNNYLTKCCGDYNTVIAELHDAGFRSIKEVTQNYIQADTNKENKIGDFDKVIVSEIRDLVWIPADSRSIGQTLAALVPQINTRRITVYFNNGRFINAHSVMHTEGF